MAPTLSVADTPTNGYSTTSPSKILSEASSTTVAKNHDVLLFWRFNSRQELPGCPTLMEHCAERTTHGLTRIPSKVSNNAVDAFSYTIVTRFPASAALNRTSSTRDYRPRQECFHRAELRSPNTCHRFGINQEEGGTVSLKVDHTPSWRELRRPLRLSFLLGGYSNHGR